MPTSRENPDTGVAGVDLPCVSAWLQAHVPALTAPFEVTMISGGRSNLTYRVADAAGHELVLRRPPLGNVLSMAHDMAREHTIITALWPTEVPVAEALGLCTDETVNGAPFYLMGLVPGLVVADLDDARRFPEQSRRVAAESMIDVLAVLHAVSPDAVGLGTLGRKEGYVERQLRRWSRQFADSKTRELPLIDDVHRRLSERIPPQRWTGIVHGDYRLGNMMLGEDGELRAVLDWELATLGDTMADLGWLISSWLEPGETSASPIAPPTTAPGFPTRAEMVARYADRTGRDVSEMAYYVAFSRWRSACIGEGVLARYRSNVMGGGEFDVQQQARSVEASAEAASAALDGEL